jgi:hypothetical protein
VRVDEWVPDPEFIERDWVFLGSNTGHRGVTNEEGRQEIPDTPAEPQPRGMEEPDEG